MLACLWFSAQAAPERLASVEHEPISEQSGIVRSRRHEGVFWVHNDSGAAPALFAIRLDGTVVAPPGAWSTDPRAGRRDPPPWPGLLLEARRTSTGRT